MVFIMQLFLVQNNIAECCVSCLKHKRSFDSIIA